MISCKLLNEERYAKSFCRGKFRYNQWGRNKITQALKFKKIGERNIKIGLKEIEEEEYFATILKLCERKLKEIKKKGLQTWQKNRLVSQSMLAKGFEMDLVLEAIKQIESNP
jgi:regulatory protein